MILLASVILIAGYINKSKCCGATILSLGCQHAQISLLEKSLKRIAQILKKQFSSWSNKKVIRKKNI